MRQTLALLAALCALAPTGCFRIGVTVGTEIPEDRVAQIVPGQTTKDDILRWFGAPSEATDGEIFARLFDAGEFAAEDLVALPFSDMLVYQIVDGNTRIMMTILFNWARVDLLRDRLVIFFDEHDVVLYYGITRQRAAAASAAGGEQVTGAEGDEANELDPPETVDVEPEAIDPAETEVPAAAEYVVVDGDSLSKIAKAHYGDPAKYTLIIDANPALRENPNRLRAGQILRIPAD